MLLRVDVAFGARYPPESDRVSSVVSDVTIRAGVRCYAQPRRRTAVSELTRREALAAAAVVAMATPGDSRPPARQSLPERNTLRNKRAEILGESTLPIAINHWDF